MLRRVSTLPGLAVQASARTAARGYVKPAAVGASNIVLELDAKKVGSEIRKRGLSSQVQNLRDGGMDRVSVIGAFSGVQFAPTLVIASHR